MPSELWHATRLEQYDRWRRIWGKLDTADASCHLISSASNEGDESEAGDDDRPEIAKGNGWVLDERGY